MKEILLKKDLFHFGYLILVQIMCLFVVNRRWNILYVNGFGKFT